jgi:hypothetical protein
MQPDHLSTWDDFTARKAVRETGEDLADPRDEIQPPPRKQTAAKLSSLLLEAIHLAGARRGRIPRAERIREQTLLEVLGQAMRRAR